MAGVFVSYRAVDHGAAERLAAYLREQGHDVWLDTWRIDVGDSVVQRLDDGLAAARYLVLCCSAAGMDGPWMNREWMSALARQLRGEDVRILPVLLTGGDPPAILRDIRYADLVTDWSAGVAELCAALGE